MSGLFPMRLAHPVELRTRYERELERDFGVRLGGVWLREGTLVGVLDVIGPDRVRVQTPSGPAIVHPSSLRLSTRPLTPA